MDNDNDFVDIIGYEGKYEINRKGDIRRKGTEHCLANDSFHQGCDHYSQTETAVNIYYPSAGFSLRLRRNSPGPPNRIAHAVGSLTRTPPNSHTPAPSGGDDAHAVCVTFTPSPGQTSSVRSPTGAPEQSVLTIHTREPRGEQAVLPLFR